MIFSKIKFCLYNLQEEKTEGDFFNFFFYPSNIQKPLFNKGNKLNSGGLKNGLQ